MSPKKRGTRAFRKTELHHLINNEEYDKVKALLKSEPQLLQDQDQDGNLPLHALLMKDTDQSGLIKLIARSYPEGCKIRNKNNELPIHIVTVGLKGTFKDLLTLAEVWPECLGQEDSKGNMPFYSCVRPDVESYYLRKGLAIYPCGAQLEEHGILPIHRAAKYGNVDQFKALASVFPDGLRKADLEGNLPFHIIARQYCCVEKLQGLFEHFTGLLKHTNHGGQLPIHLAAMNGCIENVDAIADLCPESLQAVDSDGNTCFHYMAANCKYDEVFAKLLGKYPAAIRCKNKHGQLPIGMVWILAGNNGGSGIAEMCATTLALGKLYPDGMLPLTGRDPFLHVLMSSKLPKLLRGPLEELLRFRDSVQESRHETVLSKAREDQSGTSSLNEQEVNACKNALLQNENKLKTALEQLQRERDEKQVLKRKLDDAAVQGGPEANITVLEQTFFSSLISSRGASFSNNDLKTIAKSLQGRLESAGKPESMCQLALPSILKDEDAKKETLVRFIEALKEELVETIASAPIIVATTTTPPPGEDAAGSRNKKRSRATYLADTRTCCPYVSRSSASHASL